MRSLRLGMMAAIAGLFGAKHTPPNRGNASAKGGVFGAPEPKVKRRRHRAKARRPRGQPKPIKAPGTLKQFKKREKSPVVAGAIRPSRWTSMRHCPDCHTRARRVRIVAFDSDKQRNVRPRAWVCRCVADPRELAAA